MKSMRAGKLGVENIFLHRESERGECEEEKKREMKRESNEKESEMREVQWNFLQLSEREKRGEEGR